jgi:hypothetical protein
MTPTHLAFPRVAGAHLYVTAHALSVHPAQAARASTRVSLPRWWRAWRRG